MNRQQVGVFGLLVLFVLGSGLGTGTAAAQEGGVFGESVLSIGILISVIAIGSAIGIAGYGLLNRSDDDVAAFLRKTGSVIGFMAVSGVAIGSAGYLSIGWVLQTVPDELGVLDQFGPLVALLVVFLVGPAIAVVLGLSEGAREFNRSRILGTALSTLIGAVFLVAFAMIIISFATTSDDIGPVDMVAISGLVAFVSAIASTAAMTIGHRRSNAA